MLTTNPDLDPDTHACFYKIPQEHINIAERACGWGQYHNAAQGEYFTILCQ